MKTPALSPSTTSKPIDPVDQPVAVLVIVESMRFSTPSLATAVTFTVTSVLQLLLSKLIVLLAAFQRRRPAAEPSTET